VIKRKLQTCKKGQKILRICKLLSVIDENENKFGYIKQDG
jgi:hypothetical protein